MEIKIPSYVIEEMKLYLSASDIKGVNSQNVEYKYEEERIVYSHAGHVESDLYYLIAVVSKSDEIQPLFMLGKLYPDGYFDTYLVHEIEDIDELYFTVDYDDIICTITVDDERSNVRLKTEVLSSKSSNCEVAIIDSDNYKLFFKSFGRDDKVVTFYYKSNKNVLYNLAKIHTKQIDLSQYDELENQVDEDELVEMLEDEMNACEFGKRVLSILDDCTLEDIKKIKEEIYDFKQGAK